MDLLARSRLTEMLNEGIARPVILVCTPAGFGKTTLVADWARRAKWPVGWLSLDPEDNDPVRFWRYVVAALDHACGGLGERGRSLFTGPGRASSHSAVPVLVNELESRSDEFGLVLDDYHVVESSSIHDGMAFLVDHLPPQLHVVITSRSDPPLHLPRLRASGQLVELRVSDLRFTLEETAAFLREVWQLDLAPEVVAALEDRTEGWAVGLQLAALSLRERADPRAFVKAFTGTHRYVLDYLSEEVLERQPERVRAFLLQTSILQRLTGRLCDAVTGESDGQIILEELEHANLFLIPLDDQRRWYRFHHLFADLLGARLLASSEDEAVSELHRRAAAWLQEHGLIDDAVRHGLAAGEVEEAAGLIDQHVEELLLRTSQRATLDRWASALPPEVVRARPRLLLGQAVSAQIEGRLDEVDRLLAVAERASPTDQPHAPSVGREASFLANIPACIAVTRAESARLRADPDRVARFAREALTQLASEDELFASLVHYHLSAAAWMHGRLDEAEQGIAQVLADLRAAGERYLAARVGYDLGLVQQAGGRLGAATRTYTSALEIVTEAGRPPPQTAGLALVGLAEIRRQQDDLDAALRYAIEGIERCRSHAYGPPLAAGLVTLAWIRQAKGERDNAIVAMDEAQGVVPSPEVAGLHNPAPSERARLLLAQGHVGEAARWTQVRGLSERDALSYPRERDYLVLARTLLAQDEPARTLRLLDRLDELAASQGRVGSLIQIRALRATALQSAGDHQGALAALAEALSMARPEGYVRVFADEGPPMAALLRSLVGARQRGRVKQVSRAAREQLNRVIRAFAPVTGPEARSAEAGGLIEPLTDRELEVLRLVAAGKGNREIAQELVVTLETVKKHVSNIFGKLGATSRTKAVAQARELGLIL